MVLKMKTSIHVDHFFKSLKETFQYINKYYVTVILIFSFLMGGILFYMSHLRSVNIDAVVMYCLKNRDRKACNRRPLNQKRLKNIKIRRVIFTRCLCKDLRLFNVGVSNSDFRENKFKRAYLKNVSFLNVDLFKASFYGAILENVIFENSALGGVVFNFATFRNVYFKNVDLRSAVFVGTRFENTYYSRNTKLPFSSEQAKRMGLFLKE